MPRSDTTEAVSRLGSYLSAQLRQRGWDAATFAGISKIPEATVSRIVNGTSKQKLATLLKIAEGLRVSPVEVLTVAGYDLDGGINDAQLIRLTRLVDALPWLSVGLSRIAELTEEEFQEILDYAEFRGQRRQKDRN